MKWRSNRFIRSVIAVGSGSAAGQIILVLASPIITRIYGPEVFGVWGVFNSLASIIYPVIALTYSTAIVLPGNTGHARAIVRLSFWTTLGLSGITTAIFVVWGTQLAKVLGIGHDSLVLAFTGGYVFAVGIAAIAQQWLIRIRGFNRIAMSNVAFAGFTALAQIIGGWISPTAMTLVASNTAGRSLHAGLLVALVNLLPRGVRGPKNIRQRARRAALSGRSPMRSVAVEYQKFPLFRAPQVVLDGLSQALPVTALAIIFGPGPAGLYALCRTVLSLPGQVIGNAVADVFYSRIALASQKRERLLPLVSRATIALSLALSVPFLIIVIFGPTLFSIVFGSEWSEAGVYARWLSIWLWVVVTNRPAVQSIHVLQRQLFHLIFTVASIVVRLAAIILPVTIGFGALEAVISFSIAGAVMNLILIGAVLGLCRNHDKSVLG